MEDPLLLHEHVCVFYDPSYPGALEKATVEKMLPGTYTLVNAASLGETLSAGVGTFVSFHGGAFPKTAWPHLLAFLEQGGNMAIFGGPPFTRPVDEAGQAVYEGIAYTAELGLGSCEEIMLPQEELSFLSSDVAELLTPTPFLCPQDELGRFWALTPKLTQSADHPHELGSAGPFDTVLWPLIHAVTQPEYGSPERVATPIMLFEQRGGRFAGGRWLIAPWQPTTEEVWESNVPALQRLLSLVHHGMQMLEVFPMLACYEPGERPALRIVSRTTRPQRCQIVIETPAQQTMATFQLEIPACRDLFDQRILLATCSEPGLYRITWSYTETDELALRQTTGFWVWDDTLVARTAGKRLTAGRQFFWQAGHIFPLYGTTYMDSVVQRKFLQCPNPARWDQDCAEMRASGINMIRTGIWTAWEQLVPQDGRLPEVALRALDAFVMTACAHDLQLTFTFFAFFPLPFSGENPWLDPRALRGQRDYLALLARRYAAVEIVSWDLINEPSFGDPRAIFTSRAIPQGDRFEIAAFRRWLQQQYTLNELQARWHMTPAELPSWEQMTVPAPGDYDDDVRHTDRRNSIQAGDFTHFSQVMVTQWASQMVEAIRATGNLGLIGLGQDEAEVRPAPQFYQEAVDYTTTHPWWNNDNLLWDMLMDATPNKPNVIQETGVMLVRALDGTPWRSSEAAADLLERKLYTGLCARTAGLIQWLWHTNAYMLSDNENSIGLVRADGSIKPELRVMREFGRLMEGIAPHLDEAPLSPIWILIPYTQGFLRPVLGREATQRAVRALSSACGMIPQMVGEYHLRQLLATTPQPRLVIVPGVQYLTTEAWEMLLHYADQGGSLLLSGVVRPVVSLPGREQAWNERESQNVQPVSRYEYLQGGREFGLSDLPFLFADEKIGYVSKAHNSIQVRASGRGQVIWSGLPLELADSPEALATFYRALLTYVGIEHVPMPLGLLQVRRPMRNGTLVLFVSEMSSAATVRYHCGNVTIAPNRAGALLIKETGETVCFGGCSYHEDAE